MLRWYKDAYICLAHLADVLTGQDPKDKRFAFRIARWFTRGWTLQELLAPRELIFFDQSWELLSSKRQQCEVIAQITGIGAEYVDLRHKLSRPLARASIAKGVSWAAGRKITRKEYIAYCLLGLFDIYMPMLYGEGTRAFTRLQEEIMKVSNDNSLLFWGYKEDFNDWRWKEASILAPHPEAFKNCRNIGPLRLDGFTMPSFSMNQRGLSITLPIRSDQMHEHIIYGILGCGPKMAWNSQSKTNIASFLSIPLVSTRACDAKGQLEGSQNNGYVRPNWCRVSLVSQKFLTQAKEQEIIIRRTLEEEDIFRKLPISFGLAHFPMQSFEVLGIYPPQPLVAQFTSLCANPSSQMADWHQEFPPSEGIPRKLGLYKADDWINHTEAGQRIVHTQLGSGALLIVLEYKAGAFKKLPWLWDHRSHAEYSNYLENPP